MRNNNLRIHTHTVRTRPSTGYGAGAAAGDRVGLNSQLGGSGSSRRMLSGR